MGMMREDGVMIGRFKVSGLMAELGLICKQPGKHAYKQATVERIDIPNHLNRQFVVDAPNQVWCGDITYIWAEGCWHYLAAVLNLYTRRVVGWAFSTRPDADLVVQAQYCSTYYQDIHRRHNLMCSMTDGYDCYQNALAERVNGILKGEFLLNRPADLQQATKMVAQSVRIYNQERPHTALKYKTPDAVHRASVLQ